MNLATAWLWLAQRFPDVYVNADAVREGVATLNAGIERNLTKLSSTSSSKSKAAAGKPRPRRDRNPPNRERAGAEG